MARHASAIVAAELRVVQSRRKLRDDLRGLQWRLTGALFDFLLTRRRVLKPRPP
jgi:hypothetical protein